MEPSCPLAIRTAQALICAAGWSNQRAGVLAELTGERRAAGCQPQRGVAVWSWKARARSATPRPGKSTITR